MTKIPSGQRLKNSDKYDDVYGLAYFSEKFKNKYPPEMLGEKKKTAPKKVDISLYEKILKEYLDIYFKEIYFFDGASYFLYGGLLKKVKYRPRVITIKGIKKIVNASIGFMWYQRPSELFFLCCSIKKLTGSSNRIPKIEKLYKNNFDINLIVNFEEAIEEQRKLNNNFIL